MIKQFWLYAKKTAFVSGKVEIGRRFHLGILSYVSSAYGLTLGDDVYVGKFCSIQCSGRIGNGVLIANNVGIVGRRDHEFRTVGVPVRLAPDVLSSSQLAADPVNSIEIGDDVWVGFGSTLLSGISIGRGSVISAGSVVVSDVDPYAIVAGNPAKKIGQRFSASEMELHEHHLATRSVSP